MTQFRKQLLIGIAAITLGTGAAYAQPAGSGPMGSGDRAQHRAQMQERMAKRMTELHDKLKLSAAQEPAWKTFADKMKPGARPARPDKAEWAKLSAPERMERHLAMMQQAEKRMAERLAAVKEFYAVLTPEQQKIFNEGFNFEHGRHHRPAK